MKAPVLQIPADVGAYCRNAADVLRSSHDFLDREIKQQTEWMAGEPDWRVDFDPAAIRRTRDNLAQAAAWLAWLADHGDHGQEVERLPDICGAEIIPLKK